MLMVIFYPLIDGGIEQIGLVFGRLFGKKQATGTENGNEEVKTG